MFWQSEETKSSDTNGAYGILTSIITSIVFGWLYILGLTFVVIDPAALLDTTNDAGGYALAQIFYDVFKSRYNNGTGGIVCLGVIAVAIFLCGLSSVTSNSRYIRITWRMRWRFGIEKKTTSLKHILFPFPVLNLGRCSP